MSEARRREIDQIDARLKELHTIAYKSATFPMSVASWRSSTAKGRENEAEKTRLTERRDELTLALKDDDDDSDQSVTTILSQDEHTLDDSKIRGDGAARTDKGKSKNNASKSTTDAKESKSDKDNVNDNVLAALDEIIRNKKDLVDPQNGLENLQDAYNNLQGILSRSSTKIPDKKKTERDNFLETVKRYADPSLIEKTFLVTHFNEVFPSSRDFLYTRYIEALESYRVLLIVYLVANPLEKTASSLTNSMYAKARASFTDVYKNYVNAVKSDGTYPSFLLNGIKDGSVDIYSTYITIEPEPKNQFLPDKYYTGQDRSNSRNGIPPTFYPFFDDDRIAVNKINVDIKKEVKYDDLTDKRAKSIYMDLIKYTREVDEKGIAVKRIEGLDLSPLANLPEFQAEMATKPPSMSTGVSFVPVDGTSPSVDVSDEVQKLEREITKDNQETERLKEEKRAKEKLEKDRKEQEAKRLNEEESARIEKEKLEKDRQEQEKLAADFLAAEVERRKKIEEAKLANEIKEQKREAERLEEKNKSKSGVWSAIKSGTSAVASYITSKPTSTVQTDQDLDALPSPGVQPPPTKPTPKAATAKPAVEQKEKEEKSSNPPGISTSSTNSVVPSVFYPSGTSTSSMSKVASVVVNPSKPQDKSIASIFANANKPTPEKTKNIIVAISPQNRALVETQYTALYNTWETSQVEDPLVVPPVEYGYGNDISLKSIHALSEWATIIDNSTLDADLEAELLRRVKEIARLQLKNIFKSIGLSFSVNSGLAHVRQIDTPAARKGLNKLDFLMGDTKEVQSLSDPFGEPEAIVDLIKLGYDKEVTPQAVESMVAKGQKFKDLKLLHTLHQSTTSTSTSSSSSSSLSSSSP
ncbi:unnamed protein product [Sphagnum jensenii]|uniref:Uncharacterized protein n=1 Tax=Sphagnum jensenii TaxID=128206 RepID=A0ABP0VCH4_9BRYO